MFKSKEAQNCLQAHLFSNANFPKNIEEDKNLQKIVQIDKMEET